MPIMQTSESISTLIVAPPKKALIPSFQKIKWVIDKRLCSKTTNLLLLTTLMVSFQTKRKIMIQITARCQLLGSKKQNQKPNIF